MGDQKVIRIDLTPSQKEQVKNSTGREADAVELTVQELEQRISPRLASNSNETFLAD